MITLYFLRTWVKTLLAFVVALVIEYALTLYASWWCIMLVPVTLAVFLGFTVLLYKDWKASRANGIGYRYDIIRDVTRARDRG
jgi:hypothetical protein